MRPRILTQANSAFLRRRRVARHFGGRAMLGTLAGHGPAAAAPEQMSRDLLAVAHDDPAAALARLVSGPDGLSPREAASRLAKGGPNEVAHEKPVLWWLRLWHCYSNPFDTISRELSLSSAGTTYQGAACVLVAPTQAS